MRYPVRKAWMVEAYPIVPFAPVIYLYFSSVFIAWEMGHYLLQLVLGLRNWVSCLKKRNLEYDRGFQQADLDYLQRVMMGSSNTCNVVGLNDNVNRNYQEPEEIRTWGLTI